MALSYDGDSNLQTDGAGRTFTHDAENVLRTAQLPGGTASYRYHPDGARAQKTWSGAVSRFTYWGDQEIAEYDGAGALVRRYVRLPGTVDEPFLMIDLTRPANDRERFVHQDRLGSVVLVTDAAGATRDTYAYSPYGASGAEGDGKSVNTGSGKSMASAGRLG